MIDYNQNRKVDGTVLAGSLIEVGKSGTVSYRIAVKCDDGQTVFADLWLGEGSAERTADTIRKALGHLDEDMRQLRNEAQYRGARVSLVMQWEEYEGKMREKVQWVNRFGSGPAAINDEKFAALKQKIGGLVARAVRTGNAYEPPVRVALPEDDAPAPADSDDLPF
jgi:hypothetical protein